MQILKTKDYKIFKGVVGNRPIYKPHVNNLVEAIQEKNMLQYEPVIVNKDMQIIDGQHRLEAAKILEVSIYYVVADSAYLDEIRLLNANTRDWKTNDYLVSYIALGKPEYIKLAEFAKEYSMAIPMAILVLTDNYAHPDKTRAKFKMGKFEVVNLEMAEVLASAIFELKQYCNDNCWRDRAFLIALRKIADKGLIRELVEKIKKINFTLERRANSRSYIHQFEEAFNYRRQEGNEISL